MLHVLLVTSLASSALSASNSRPWMDTAKPPEVRAKLLLAAMTTDEKLELFHGSCEGYVGNVCGNERLGIPPIKMQNGPQGVTPQRLEDIGTTTAWPSSLTVAASFDDTLARAWGEAMGDEFYRKGANVQLGPGVCVARVPRNGRNFEYVSGEDPHLGYRMVAAVVAGIQSQGVVANVKHWVNNNQETDRLTVTAVVDERTQFEIYYPPFEGAVAAGVGSAMCSYNKICQNCPLGTEGKWSCEDPDTLRDLKDRLGFKGWVMSDWGATHSASMDQGLDQQMPDATYMGDVLKKLVSNGNVSMAKVDDSAWRILWPLFAVGAFDTLNNHSSSSNVTTLAHNYLARKVSAAGTVLLKNENSILPISSKVKNILVLGYEAVWPTIVGWGSGFVPPYYTVSPIDAIHHRFGLPPMQHSESDCATRSCRDGRCVINASTCYDAAVLSECAKEADLVLVFAGTTSTEGADRIDLSLPPGQDAVLQNFSKVAGNKTVVIVATPGALLTPWRDSVAGVVTSLLPGQEYGNAIMDVLFGDVNPSGKLPVTFPGEENEMNFTQEQWPGVNGIAVYSERLEVGYRWYNAHNVKPAFPFGHGLSYTTFTYSNFVAEGHTIRVTIQNTGIVPGTEIAQLYLTYPPIAQEPPKQLKDYAKVYLEPGESVDITFKLSERSFSIWNAVTHAWTVVPGDFVAHVGSSVEDTRLNGIMTGSSDSVARVFI